MGRTCIRMTASGGGLEPIDRRGGRVRVRGGVCLLRYFVTRVSDARRNIYPIFLFSTSNFLCERTRGDTKTYTTLITPTTSCEMRVGYGRLLGSSMTTCEMRVGFRPPTVSVKKAHNKNGTTTEKSKTTRSTAPTKGRTDGQ